MKIGNCNLKISKNLVRLACIRHTASVNPEPGSNSPQNEDCITYKKLKAFLVNTTLHKMNVLKKTFKKSLKSELLVRYSFSKKLQVTL